MILGTLMILIWQWFLDVITVVYIFTVLSFRYSCLYHYITILSCHYSCLNHSNVIFYHYLSLQLFIQLQSFIFLPLQFFIFLQLLSVVTNCCLYHLQCKLKLYIIHGSQLYLVFFLPVDTNASTAFIFSSQWKSTHQWNGLYKRPFTVMRSLITAVVHRINCHFYCSRHKYPLGTYFFKKRLIS